MRRLQLLRYRQNSSYWIFILVICHYGYQFGKCLTISSLASRDPEMSFSSKETTAEDLLYAKSMRNGSEGTAAKKDNNQIKIAEDVDNDNDKKNSLLSSSFLPKKRKRSTNMTTLPHGMNEIITNHMNLQQANLLSSNRNENAQMTANVGICQIYSGTTCDKFLRDQPVFVPMNLTMEILEDRLKAAYGVIRESKDMNQNCRIYALPSLCYSVLPICRTPERTNHQYFANRAAAISKQHRINKSSTTKIPSSHNSDVSVDNAALDRRDKRFLQQDRSKQFLGTKEKRYLFKKNKLVSFDASAVYTVPEISSRYPPTRNTENLRRICRDECELLENELCQKEYAIAKRHPAIGHKLPLEDCHNVPHDNDCSSFGIAIDVEPDATCFWENGSGYRGTVAMSASGKPCLKWSWLMKEISNFPELAGQNYCRNPGKTQDQPWCFVDDKSLEKIIEYCDIPKCANQMWLYIIISFILIVGFVVTVGTYMCYKRSKKQGMTNIQNISLPNADKNIYGNSQMNSSFEMKRICCGNGAESQHSPGVVAVSTTGSGTVKITPPPSNFSQNSQRIQHKCLDASFGHSDGANESTVVVLTADGNRMGPSTTRVPQYTLQDVKFVEELGEGAFGKVYKGELTQTNGEKMYVAVKALKENASVKTQADFKREIELISDLRHDNIVCILGVVLNKEPLCMLFEYMSHGDLHEFLIGNSPNENKSLSQMQFLYIAMQISDGMEYLSGHHYVHRDLAARNCLVAENLTVKISDFGLSRDIYSSDYYRVQSKSLLPVRWMPSESILYGKFTTESDVWSFGVVLWEIYSYGLQPYYGYSNQEVISMVRARQLLPCPEACPTAVYSLMIECWHEQSVRRPSFSEISHRLRVWHQTQKKCHQSVHTTQNLPSLTSLLAHQHSCCNSQHSSMEKI